MWPDAFGVSPVGVRAEGATSRLAQLSALVALVAVFSAVAWKATSDPDIAYLASHDPAQWIVYPSPGDPNSHPGIDSEAVFRRTFVLNALPPSGILRVRAFRRVSLWFNGQPLVLEPTEASWKSARQADVTGLLRVGENHVEAMVSNRLGPPSLWLSMELPGGPLISDSEWDTSWAGATWQRAALANGEKGGRRFDPNGRMKRPAAALGARWRTLAAFGALSLACVGVGLRIGGQRVTRGARASVSPWPLRAVLLLAILLWIALFFNNASWMSVSRVGFDATAHLDYIRYILERHALPLADNGAQMYQPPLYYALAAAVFRVANLQPNDLGAAFAVRLLGLGFGVINLLLVGASLRLIFPEHARRQVLGVIVAACLPPLLCLYQFVSNEGLLITLCSATVLMTLRVLRDERPLPRMYICLGAGIGLALLTKVSALLLVPPVVLVLVLPSTARSAKSWWRRGVEAGVVILSALLVCGWHYGRVWLHFGRPVVMNYDPHSGFAWWLDPGYRTLADYSCFGRILVDPLAGSRRVWDGFYSTLWGDGLGSGVVDLAAAPPWSFDLMSMGYVLALIPSTAMLLGVLFAVVTWMRRPNLVGQLVIVLAGLVLAGMILFTLQPAYVSTHKAFYGFVGLVPLCAFVALGLDLAMGRPRWLTTLVMAGFGTWALTSYATYWIDGDTSQAQTALGIRLIEAGDINRGMGHLRRAVSLDPGDWYVRGLLVRILSQRGAERSEIERLLAEDAGQTDVAARHYLRATVAGQAQDLDVALLEAERAVALDPDAYDAYGLLGSLLEYRGETRRAVDAWREALRINAFSRPAHESLGRLYESLGLDAEAAMHGLYAERLALR